MKSQILTVRVSEALKDDLDYLSEIKGESISDLSRKAIENYVKTSLGEDDTSVVIESEKETSFNLIEGVLQVYNKDLLLNEVEITDLYYKFKATFNDVKHDDLSKSILYNELKSTKTKLQTLITLFWWYLDDVFTLDEELDYVRFSDFLQRLDTSLNEPREFVLKIPE
ncbi:MULTISPECIES: hypothetical protein [unclassified Polaribacter]|jgi:hypothetical protein|uniref:hypothetical protein n=1 Tax=unclassified Polaribacter TaxID=196858 RepID=UPI001C4FDC88|nr:MULTISPECIES: hypothetical protein [unclassified Polaribacter]QXP63924.1 hypothetical protein H0I27_01615 [Polaribacter sp. HaHaR_3_91]QXP66424.1 hypothetical protein H0I28_14775 [Polaribacter sp. AHE13PA]